MERWKRQNNRKVLVSCGISSVGAEHLAKLFSRMDQNSPERAAFVSRALKWSTGGSSKLGHPKLHQLLALTLWKGNQSCEEDLTQKPVQNFRVESCLSLRRSCCDSSGRPGGAPTVSIWAEDSKLRRCNICVEIQNSLHWRLFWESLDKASLRTGLFCFNKHTCQISGALILKVHLHKTLPLFNLTILKEANYGSLRNSVILVCF